MSKTPECQKLPKLAPFLSFHSIQNRVKTSALILFKLTYTLFWNQVPEEAFFKGWKYRSQFNYFHEHPSKVLSVLLDTHSKQNFVYLFTYFVLH